MTLKELDIPASVRAAYFSDNGAEPCRWIETASGETLLVEHSEGGVITLGGEYLGVLPSG